MFNKISVFIITLTFICLSQLINANNAAYYWKVSLKQQHDDLTFKTTNLLFNLKPINLTSTLNTQDVLPFSELHQDELVNKEYASSVYVLEVVVVDSIDQVVEIIENKINYGVMRSVLLAGGSPPVIHLTYLRGSYSLDSGASQFSITGCIINNKNVDENLAMFSWYYPLPINQYSASIYLDIQEVRTGVSVIQEMRKVYHLNLFGNNWGIGDEKIEFEATFQPLHLDSATTVVSIGDNLIISSNEFESSVVKKIPDHNSAVSCSIFNSVLQLSNILLHFTPTGIYGLEQDSTDWIKISDLNCPSHISGSRQDLDFVVVTVENQIYASNFKGNDSDFHFELVRDVDDKTWCEFIGRHDSQCSVIGHTVPLNKCCMFYVLTYDDLDKKYSVGQYTGGNGKWKILHTFHTQIPTSQYRHSSSGFVFLDENGISTGESMDLNGIQTLGLSDENLYLFGKIFLVLDIRSCTLLAAETEENSIFFGNTAVRQMASASKTRKFSLLTSSGEIWTGSVAPSFGGIKLDQVGSTDISEVVGLFFDFQDDLFVLVLDDGAMRRDLVQSHDKIEQQMFIASAISCVDVTTLSRIRRFHFDPPRYWPGTSEEIIRRNDDLFPFADTIFSPHSENLFSLYRVSSQMVYVAQKIGQYQWWSNGITGDWYFDLHGFEDYLDYLSVNNLSNNNKSMTYLSKYDYMLDLRQGDIRCSVLEPTTVYLDKGQVFKVEILLTPGPDNPLSILANTDLFVSLSDHQLVDMSIVKYKESMHKRFEVTFTGNQLTQLPPGVKLSSIYANISPWTPNMEAQPKDLNVIIKVGCPPAYSLEFDREESVRMLAERGRTDNFECLYDLGDNIPCFTTSEFVTAFTVQDHVSGTHSPFTGNFTLKVVAGGVGYIENVRTYTDEEIAMFNYRPGVNEVMESLIWSVLDDSLDEKMKDNATGALIFDSNNPSSIVFECRIDSPCGSIPFGTKNPSEFFFVIETSNKGVDTSTNCDFTMRFTIHLIGIELNPRSHFSIMLVVLSILLVSIFSYYQLSAGGGKEMWKKFMRNFKKEKFSEPPLHLRNILQKRNEASVASILQNPIRGARRGSLLADSLMADARTRRKSIALVADLRRQSFAIRGPNIVLNDDDLDELDIVKSSGEMKNK